MDKLSAQYYWNTIV